MIVEDQGMVRAFFERWVAGMPRFAVVGAARSGEEAVTQVEQARPDLALVDFQLPGMDGLEFVHAARQVRPQLRALVVSSLADPVTLTLIRESGVEGYIEKDASPEMLAEALQAVADGGSYYSRVFRETIVRQGADAEGVGKILSRREQQVLALLLAKKTNREIAEQMNLSQRTVEFHRANLMTKLEVSSYADLIVAAHLRGWAGR